MSKILIIDDSDISANQLSRQLMSQYFDIVRINSSQNSIEAISVDIFKAVIIDAIMSGELAFELCTKIKASFPQMPVFIVSPIFSNEAKLKALRVGAEDYIAKPFDLDLFITRLRYAIKTKDDLEQLLSRNKNSDLSALINNKMDFASASIILVDDDIAESTYIREILEDKVASLVIVENLTALTDEVIAKSEVIIASGYLVNNFGVEICSKIKNDVRFNEKSFMLLVSQDDDELLKEAYKAGINEFAVTPLSSEAFLIRLRKLLNITRFKKQLVGKLINELNLAIVDPLTNLYNRRYFDNKTVNIIAGQISEQKPLSLMIADIDKFKTVNDTYGHLMGDQVLIEAANRLKDAVAENGGVYRFGGEEFVVLLEGKTLEEAASLAELIRQNIAKDKFKISSEPFEIPVTISLGVATLNDRDTEISSLIARADQGLYQAKDAGRNKVMVITGDEQINHQSQI